MDNSLFKQKRKAHGIPAGIDPVSYIGAINKELERAKRILFKELCLMLAPKGIEKMKSQRGLHKAINDGFNLVNSSIRLNKQAMRLTNVSIVMLLSVSVSIPLTVVLAFTTHSFYLIALLAALIGIVWLGYQLVKIKIETKEALISSNKSTLKKVRLVQDELKQKIELIEKEMDTAQKEFSVSVKQLEIVYAKPNKKAACSECGQCPYVGDNVAAWTSAHHAITGH